MIALARRTFLVLALAFPAAAYAQPTPGTDCPPETDSPAPIDSNDICTVRVIDFESRIKALGDLLCTNSDPAATKAAEDKVAKEFGDILKDCSDAALGAKSDLTQAYLYSWLNGPSEGWGDDLTVRGVKIPQNARDYREAITSSYGSPDKDKMPAFYKEKAAYAEAVAALLSGARDTIKDGSSWSLSNAETKISRVKEYLGADDPRVKFLESMLARIKTPGTDDIPKELIEAYAANPPMRLNGSAGFYTSFCDPKAAKDDAIADGVQLTWAAHLRQHGPRNLEKLDATVNAAKSAMTSASRLEQSFGAEMTGAWMSKYVKDTYFREDTRAADVSPEMASAMASAVNNSVRERFGLPKLAGGQEATGASMGLAGSRFDSNDNLRVVFPGKCTLVDVRHVNGDGTTGDVVKETGWDPRGIYDGDSYQNDKDFPLSELVLREPAGTNKDKARSYDVTMKCEGATRKTRLSIPPRPDTTEAIDFVTPDTAPPYEGMLADGALNGLMIGGYHTRDGEVAVKAMKELGFREVSRKDDINMTDRFYELLGEKKNGKPVVDYFVKDAHANGYAYDAGMFRANKRGQEVVLEKTGPDGKKHRITLLGNKPGEGKEGGPEGFETVTYAKYFDTMAARGDATTFIANFSCWSAGKSAFEWDGIRNKSVKYLPTDQAASYWEHYWRGMGSRENTFQIVGALDKKMDYAKMRDTYDNFDGEVLMPDDPTFVTTMTDHIKSHRASSSGIPVRVSLQDSRPNS